jgi:hypothetical protein
MFTETTFKNPTFQKNIRQALWLARMESKKTGHRVVNYVTNRHNERVLRLDVYNGFLTSVLAAGSCKNFFKEVENNL